MLGTPVSVVTQNVPRHCRMCPLFPHKVANDPVQDACHRGWEMTQQLTEIMALTEGWILIPRIHTRWLTTTSAGICTCAHMPT